MERSTRTAAQEQATAPAPPAFIGRDAELVALDDALLRAHSGERQLVLLSGEPGIGKTATLTQFARHAREQSALVLWGSCYEWEGAPAYWAWTQVLSALLRYFAADELDALLGANAAEIALLVPDLSLDDAHRTPDQALSAEARRFRLMSAVANVLRRAAEHRLVVVVLDDIHWADTPTLELLLFVTQEIREARLLLAADYREAELAGQRRGRAVMADLARDPQARRLALQGLPRPQVARLVSVVTGRAQAPGLVEQVYSETDGNPFFVIEVARLLNEEMSPDVDHDGDADRAGVPDSVREAVQRRLDRLSSDCNRTLTVCSVVGREFAARLLGRALETTALRQLEALDEAAQARLIGPTDVPDIFRFSHALVQETIYQSIPTAERARLHLAVGEALEQERPHDPPWAELARHFYQASLLAPPEKIARYASRAGDEAMAHFNWGIAAAHYQHALDALDLLHDTQADRRCDLLLALGEAQNRSGSGAGDAPAARASCSQAFDLARELGDAERMARAAVGYAGQNIVAAFGGSRQLDLLEEALAALSPVDSPLRVRVLGRLAMDLWYRSTDNRERSRALAEEAVAAALRLDDPTLLAYALNGRHSSGHSPDNLEQRTVCGALLVAAAEQTGDPIAASWGAILQLMDDIEAGNMFGAEQALAWLRQFDQRVHIPYVAQRVAVCWAMLALLTGRYDEAGPQVELARELWQSTAPRQHASQAFVLLRDLGRLDELAEDFRLPDRLHPWRSVAQAHRMLLALERGEADSARADYETLVSDDFALVPFNQHFLSTLAVLAEAAVAFEDTAQAVRIAQLMAPYPTRQIYDGSLGVCHGPSALYLGRLATLLGHWDDATRWLDQSLGICERLGLRPYKARTLLAQAELLLRRDGYATPGARELAARAIEIAETIGMNGLLPQATAIRDAPAPAQRSPFGLTPRELEVLRLITQGLTDAEAAQRLFVSQRTVGTHLTSIYTKLNVSSRTAATRLAIEHGLS